MIWLTLGSVEKTPWTKETHRGHLCFLFLTVARVLGSGDLDNPARVPARIDSSVWLPCPLDTSHRSTVEWSRVGRILLYVESLSQVTNYGADYSNLTHRFEPANNSLAILRVGFADNQSPPLKCTVTYANLAVLEYYSVAAIYAPPTNVTVSDQTLNIIENASVDLTCNVALVYPDNTLQMYIILGQRRCLLGNGSVSYVSNPDGTKRAQTRCTVQFNRTANGQHVQCVADFQYDGVYPETVLSSHIPVTVRFPPSNTRIDNLSLAMRENKSLSFRCTTEVLNPEASLTNLLWEIDFTLQNNATGPAFTNASSGYGGYTASSIVIFPALRTYNQKSLTCTPEWENHRIAAQSSVTLTVYYLPEIGVTVSGQPNESNTCALTCYLTGGNPSNTTEYTFSWFLRANHELLETNLRHSQQSLSFNPVTHHHSGLYRCEASSVAAGTARGETWLDINHAPVGINVQENSKTIYSSYNTSTQLNLTVHSFPAGVNTNFTWTKNNTYVASHKEILGNNQTRSTVIINYVSEANYGYYTVDVSNGGSRRSVFLVELKLQGKPTPAFEINPLSISYRQIVLSLRPGMDGGRNQTIKVEYKKVNTDIFHDAGNVDNPVHGVQQHFKIAREIEPSTEYEIVITSDNTFEGPPTRATPLLVTTKVKPTVKVKDLSIVVTGDEFTLRWPEVVLEAGDSLYVQQCGGECLTYDVSGATGGVFQRDNGTSFNILHYQGLDLVLNLEFVEKKYTTDVTNNGGVIAGSVISVIFIAVLISLGFLYWRKFRRPGRTKSDANVYMTTRNITNVDNAARVYDEVKITQQNNEEYTSLTPLRSATVHENFIFSNNYKTDIIHSGHFITYQCQLKYGLCALKTLKGDASYIHDAKWILAQTATMKNLPLHRNIAEIVACISVFETPLLVTKLSVNGDLKSTSCDRNTADGIIVSVRNALDIVEGMNFLSKYKLLHYELSTSHVLLGHNDECKIINFASADSVRARQMISLKLNDWSCVPWLAPECLISAEQHCTASDVWSFGVLLYEIIVSGVTPYNDMSSEEIGEFALQGNTLDIPVDGKHFGEIITNCWNFEPADRPDWTQLKEMLLVLHAQFPASAGVYETVSFEGP